MPGRCIPPYVHPWFARHLRARGTIRSSTRSIARTMPHLYYLIRCPPGSTPFASRSVTAVRECGGSPRCRLIPHLHLQALARQQEVRLRRGVQALLHRGPAIGASSTGGTARLAAAATNGDSVPGNSCISGAVATAKIMMPAAAAAETMPPQCNTRAVQGSAGRSTVRLRTAAQLAPEGAYPSTRSPSARRRLLTSCRSIPISRRQSAQDSRWARCGPELRSELFAEGEPLQELATCAATAHGSTPSHRPARAAPPGAAIAAP